MMSTPGFSTRPTQGLARAWNVPLPVEYPEGSQPLTVDKPGAPEQVARLVLFLASDAADHITGTEMWIDGGASLLQG